MAAQLFEGRRQMRLEIFVREDLQNRVDARRDGYQEPVRVRISLKTLPANLISKYFPQTFQDWYCQTETQGLSADEKTRRIEEIEALFSSDEFRVLVIEDFECTGLNGPINSFIPEKDPTNPLYHATNALTCFFRRNGASGKTDKKLGSAGLGRHVYYKASMISTKLIYTVPIDLSRELAGRLEPLPPRPLFFGQSFQRELAVREGGRQRRYCSYHHLSGREVDRLPMPFGLADDEGKFVEQARIDFRLTRTPDQPGCSVIIPFPKLNFDDDGLVNSVVRDFSMPILSRALEVEIDGTVIDADNIASLSDKTEVNQHNAFLSNAIHSRPDVIVSVDSDRLRWPFSEDLFDESDLSELAQTFKDHGLVCVQADIRFGPRSDQAGSILVSAQKTDGGKRGRHIVSRSGLVLSNYSDRNFQKASNAMVLVQPDPLGSLLRSSENPAHSEWLAGDIDLHRCACPNELIQFIKHSHNALDRILSNLDTEDDLNIFNDLLPAGPRRPPTEPRKSPFDVALAPDGQSFLLRPSEAYDVEPDTNWRVSLIYDSVYGSGRARKGYRPGSFDLQHVPMSIEGGSLIESGECHFDVSVADPENFKMTFGPCGFAGWADIRFHAELANSNDEIES